VPVSVLISLALPSASSYPAHLRPSLTATLAVSRAFEKCNCSHSCACAPPVSTPPVATPVNRNAEMTRTYPRTQPNVAPFTHVSTRHIGILRGLVPSPAPREHGEQPHALETAPCALGDAGRRVRTVRGVGVLLVLVLLGACGGNSAEDSSPAQVLPPKWNHETTKISDVETARSVVRHQQEDHCGAKRLVEVTCTDAGDVWRCEYRTDRGSGTTEIERDFGNNGEAVTC
jgi:hypothetical protein